MTQALEEQYSILEERFRPTADANYERLVVPQGNTDEPIHRWFHMKEAYSPYLLPRVLKDLGLSGRDQLRIHDPFLGSGTTLLAGLLAADSPHVLGSGSEINPFLRLLARTKLDAAGASSGDREMAANQLDETGAALVALCAKSRKKPAAPSLAAFNDSRFFGSRELNHLLLMRDHWASMPSGRVKDLVGIALASCVEPCSRLRRDGRALRYAEGRVPEDPRILVLERLAAISEDLRSVASRGSTAVVGASALERGSWPRSEAVDLVCFSPPYPNNIDYTEVYKLEAWYLGLISDTAAFKSERDATVRSHPSIVFSERSSSDLPDGVLKTVKALADPLVAAVPEDRYKRQRVRVIEGYLEDMATVLCHAHDVLAAGGSAVYVVGNSRHGSPSAHYTIASDILMASIAESVGFEVDQVKTARSLHRRGRHEHLRESVVVLRKGARR